MFKEIGQIAGMLRNLPKMQEQFAELQAKLGRVIVEGDAGAGMVVAKVNGKLEIVSIAISPEAISDRELLEDLLRAAINQALEKARSAVAQEASSLTGGMGLPPGLNLPGMG